MGAVPLSASPTKVSPTHLHNKALSIYFFGVDAAKDNRHLLYYALEARLTEHIILHYTVLLIHELDEVFGSKVYDAATDEAALATARSWMGTARAVEVWQGPRLVGRYPPKDTPTPSG